MAVEVRSKPRRWTTRQELEAAKKAFPRDVPDEQHVARIMAETGLSRHRAIECLAIIRGAPGDCVELPESSSIIPGAF